MKKLSVIIAAVLTWFPVQAQILTDSFTPTNDAYVNSGSTATNYGSADTLMVFFKQSPIGNSFQRSYLRFDLTAIPAEAIIVSAKLKLYPKSINNSLNHPIYVQRVDTAAWTEGAVNYSNGPSGITSDQV